MQMRTTLTVLIALAVAGCGQRQDTGPKAPIADHQRTTVTSDSLTIRRFDASNVGIYRYNSGIRDSTFVIVRDAVRWEHMWRVLTARHGPPRPPPPIDFQNEMALVATLGERPTGGYAITIEAVIDRGAYIEAHVLRRAPGPDCGVTGAISAPADVAIVPRRQVEVRTLSRDHVRDCSKREAVRPP